MSNYSEVPVEYIVARSFVKYSRLNELISFAYDGSKARSINLYIDMYSLYKTLFSRSYRTRVADYTAFTSSIINMCAHYKYFFRGLGVYARVFLISSYNVPDNSCKYVSGYNKTFQDKLLNTTVKEMMEFNSELLEVLCPYLPDIHFLKTNFESSVLIKHLIEKEMSKGNNSPNMIISTDIYPIQLTSMFPQTTFLRPKKYNGDDLSSIVVPREHEMHTYSFWSLICSRDRDNLGYNADNINISTNNFALVSAMNRFPERNIKALFNISDTVKIIKNTIFDPTIKININTLYDASVELQGKIGLSILDARYKVLDVDYQSLIFNESMEPMLINYENLSDPEVIQMINSKYFQNNPIDIFKLQ